MFAKSPFATVITAAVEESRRRGDRRLGTEHLLLGLLNAPDSAPARALGVDLDTARAALDSLDRTALAAIGIDTDGLEFRTPSHKRSPFSRSSLTSGCRSAITRSVKQSRTMTKHLAPTYLLRSLLECEQPDPAAELLTRLGIDRAAVARAITD